MPGGGRRVQEWHLANHAPVIFVFVTITFNLRKTTEPPSAQTFIYGFIIQRSQKWFVRGCEKFVPALAYLLCPALPGPCLARFAYFFWSSQKRSVIPAKQDPGRARQNRYARAGTTFSQPRTFLGPRPREVVPRIPHFRLGNKVMS